MVAGAVVAERLGLKAGDPAVLLGRTFKVAAVQPPRGNEDDVTVWIDLGEAQALLAKPGLINSILALSCFCAEATLVGITKEVGTILEHKVQVVELAPQAATRRAARARAATHGEESLAAEAAGREKLRAERHALVAWLLPLIIAGCTVWVGLLAFSNVRERRTEIGVLRAVGVRAGQVFAVFLAKALVVGLIGAVVGYAAGLAIAAVWDAYEAGAAGAVGLAALWMPGLALAVLAAAPLVSAAASLVPAMTAAGQDPALVLREE
jgi:predicted lysophospholipase L1 biosynthesis ABC-type transport system permease subunit